MSRNRVFFDTNVLLYLLSGDVNKADRAEGLVARGGVISVQVLNEFASVASRKLGLTWPEIREILATLQKACVVEPLAVETHELGLSLAERYGFAVYDALILAAAQMADCRIVYTEDMQHGQVLDGRTRICNPFVGD